MCLFFQLTLFTRKEESVFEFCDWFSCSLRNCTHEWAARTACVVCHFMCMYITEDYSGLVADTRSSRRAPTVGGLARLTARWGTFPPASWRRSPFQSRKTKPRGSTRSLSMASWDTSPHRKLGMTSAHVSYLAR